MLSRAIEIAAAVVSLVILGWFIRQHYEGLYQATEEKYENIARTLEKHGMPLTQLEAALGQIDGLRSARTELERLINRAKGLAESRADTIQQLRRAVAGKVIHDTAVVIVRDTLLQVRVDTFFIDAAGTKTRFGTLDLTDLDPKELLLIYRESFSVSGYKSQVRAGELTGTSISLPKVSDNPPTFYFTLFPPQNQSPLTPFYISTERPVGSFRYRGIIYCVDLEDVELDYDKTPKRALIRIYHVARAEAPDPE